MSDMSVFLDEIRDYLEEKAEAEFTPGRSMPSLNEEMRLLNLLDTALVKTEGKAVACVTDLGLGGGDRVVQWYVDPMPDGTLLYTHPHNGEQGDKRCSWRKGMADWDGNTWESDCGASWVFINEGPVQNEMNYCPKCGRKLSQLPAPPTEREHGQ